MNMKKGFAVLAALVSVFSVCSEMHEACPVLAAEEKTSLTPGTAYAFRCTIQNGEESTTLYVHTGEIELLNIDLDKTVNGPDSLNPQPIIMEDGSYFYWGCQEFTYRELLQLCEKLNAFTGREGVSVSLTINEEKNSCQIVFYSYNDMGEIEAVRNFLKEQDINPNDEKIQFIYACGTEDPYEGSSVYIGDVNVDGEVSVADAVLIQKIVNGSVIMTLQSPSDCDGDGEITANDCVTLLRFLVHLVPELPYTGE
ncbi:MAG: dockerin type I repeat-containing protein [Ruminococcus sp.]